MNKIGWMSINRSVIIILLIWALLASSWLLAHSAGVGGRPLQMAWSYDPANYDPHRTTDPISYSIFRHVCEPLFYENFDGNVRGLLAEDQVEYTDNGQRLIVHLRPGIVFHDGTLLTAQAVQFSFQRLSRLGVSPLIHDLHGVEVLVIDAHTVEFRFPSPDYDFARLVLSNPYAVVVSPNIIEQERTGFIACTGPYQFAPELYTPDRSLTLVRYANYQWPPAFFNNRKAAYIHQLHFVFHEDSEERFNTLLQGQGCALSLDPEHLEKIRDLPHYRLHKAKGGITYLGFNFLQPRWQDKRIRQAVAMAINKTVLATSGPFETANTPLSQATTGYDKRVASYEYGYDPARSHQLLVDAHFDFSAQIIFLIPQSHTYQKLSTIIRKNLAEVGIQNVEIREASRSDISKGGQQFDLLLFDYAWGDYTSLAIFLGPGPRNLLSYPNGNIFALVRQARTTAGVEQRREILLSAQRIILEDAVWQPLLVRNLTFAINSLCIQNERQSPFGELLFHDAHTN